MDTLPEMTRTEAAAAHALEAAGISYIRLTHAPAATMELCRGIGAVEEISPSLFEPP